MRETYLDGLRGWASLFVLFGHLGPVFLLTGHTFPPVPFLIDARLAVFVFFALSGYVLSITFFHTGERIEVVSLALRRYLRLTIPIAASLLIAFLVQVSGLAHNQAAGVAADSPWLTLGFSIPVRFPELLQFSLWDVYRFAPRDAIFYNAALWTMPFELLGSFLIFACLLVAGTSRLAQATIVCTFCALTWWASSYFLPFALGMAIALLRAAAWPSLPRGLAGAGLAAVLVLAALRLPEDSIRSLSVFATLILATCMLSPGARRFLDLPISQWLGRISFPLYLTHLFAIYTVGAALYLWLGDGGKITAAGTLVVAAASTAAALALARAFLPVESFSVSAGRSFSRGVLRLVSRPLRVRA
jgi:peptidoglycan/LPS O-acetylase OafA/YrhL